MEVSRRLRRSASLPPKKNPGTHSIGGRVGTKVRREILEKRNIIFSLAGFEVDKLHRLVLEQRNTFLLLSNDFFIYSCYSCHEFLRH